jgi:DNA-binding SARP family transcriptional activator
MNLIDVRLNIEMLGGFFIFAGENQVTEHMRRSSKLLKLLQYLIAFRHKTISRDDLLEAFYGSKEMENPDCALRMMVHRARSTLENNGLPYANEIILYKSGSYAWNNAIPCGVDSEEFESLCKTAMTKTVEDERLDLLMRATKLYRGDFLPSSAGEMWVMPLMRWYRSMFISSAHGALELLIKTGRKDDAEELCVKALQIDPFEEDLLEYHLRVLLIQGKNALALSEYKRMESVFYDVMGVHFSEKLRALYYRIKKPVVKEGVPLKSVLKEWLEGAEFLGAYYCDLSVFKTLYQIESRSLSRNGRKAFIVSFETRHEPNEKGGDIMKHLGLAIVGCLRKGDLFTRSSPSQYMLMLHSLKLEDCNNLITRILHTLDAKYLPGITGSSVEPIKRID